MVDDKVVPCWIYRSDKKLETYLYLAAEDGTDVVPDALLCAMLPLELVMQLTYTPNASSRERTSNK